ncbi:MAG: serine/threonine-protein kinase [Polyangiales bacterium]
MDTLPLECPECGERFPQESSFCPHDGQALVGAGASTLMYDGDPSGGHAAEESFVGAPSRVTEENPSGGFGGEHTDEAPPRVPSRIPSVLPAPPLQPPKQDPLLGSLVGSYRVEGVLGQGGMGRIYRAVHTQLGKVVAIKVLRAEVAEDGEANARFIREARSTSAIGHPNIVDVLDFGALEDGRSYFVMELLEGGSLYHVIKQLGRIEPPRALRMIERLASALQAAHTRGIIHRDLKPGNVFVCGDIHRSSEVKLLDFGIAKIADATVRLTVAGSIFGTPQYMAPEQCIGSEVDHRADIYALGILLFEMLTGAPPFDDRVPVEILIKQRSSPVPHLPRELAALDPLIQRVLAKEPDARYQSMSEFGIAVEDASDALNAPQAAEPVAPERARTVGFNYEAPPTDVAAPAPYANVQPASAPANAPPVASHASALAPPTPAVQPARPSSSRGRIALLIMGALTVILIGAGLVITFASPTEDVAPRAVPLAPAAAALINVTTQPAGAQVFSGQTLVGVTPCPIPRPAADQAFRVSLSGHVDATFSLGPASSDVHSVVLVPSP